MGAKMKKEWDSNKIFKGIFPALLTPITEEGIIRRDGLKKLIDWELYHGADGFYIGGATGECYSMETEAREELAKEALRVIDGRGRCIVHIGAYSVREGIRLARQAEKAGADAISATPPPVYRYGMEETVDYYRQLSEAVDIPMLVYVNYMLGEQDPTVLMEKVLELPGVIGMKFTRNDYYELFRISRLQGGNINLLNGPDETLLCGLVMGADGGIGSTYNIMPGIYKKIYGAFREGDMKSARNWQFQADNIIEVLLKYGQIRAMKFLFNRKGISLGKAEKRAVDLSDGEEQQLLCELEAAGYFREYPEMK